jgi:hypothetical protein
MTKTTWKCSVERTAKTVEIHIVMTVADALRLDFLITKSIRYPTTNHCPIWGSTDDGKIATDYQLQRFIVYCSSLLD